MGIIFTKLVQLFSNVGEFLKLFFIVFFVFYAQL